MQSDIEGAEMVRVVLFVSVGLVGCKREEIVEVPREDWDDMDEKSKDEFMRERMFELIEWGYDAD